MKLKDKIRLNNKRRARIRKKISGTSTTPRLSFHQSNKHLTAQCIDDVSSITLCSLTTLSKNIKQLSLKANLESAAKLGELFGEKAHSAGITKVVFDRNGKPFHGVVKAFAEGARKSLNF